MRSRTALVIPCYNEGSRLQTEEFKRFVRRTDCTLVFVNDGSTDDTAAVLQGLECERLRVVTLVRNSGKAEAVRQGVNAVLAEGFEFVGFWDADLATPLGCVEPFEHLLREQPAIDMVLGARVKLLGRSIDRKASRHHLGRVFATAASLTLGLPIYDTQCGAKLFRNSDVMRSIFRDPFSSRWVFDVEILARYIAHLRSSEHAERHIYEYPLEQWCDIAGSKVRAKDFFVSFFDLMHVAWTYRVSWTYRAQLPAISSGPQVNVPGGTSR